MKFAVVTVLIFSLFASAMSLKCYTCDNISSSSGCEERDFDPSKASKSTCAKDEVCVKSTYGKLVGRGCGPSGFSDECYSGESIKSCYWYCSTDLCNSAVSKHLGFTLAFISLGAAMYL